jgi:hypothetical protein
MKRKSKEQELRKEENEKVEIKKSYKNCCRKCNTKEKERD